MRGRKRRAPAADLSRASARFEHWRQGRAAGSRIPAALWNLAVDVARRHGVARTAAALRDPYGRCAVVKIVDRPEELVARKSKPARNSTD